ncbi:hypothetical protein FIBSPDRAFT_849026 [Athelia psychrophila]|uniref:P-loop containing nucleoside triphosphate hydrolase protein n=1 Tax=Athelia psychrophila TaxID=1759441 RepID=A0A166UUX1_9AGAM|nr:hypothetical protein FIBSPDRAFT_849026 [Fibularhizoctonia sp. CBS 109695]
MIAGKDVAQTSSDLTGCTFDSQAYDVKVDESLTVTLWDTAGLNKGSRGDNDTIRRVCELIIRLEKSAILLIFCLRDRIRDGTFENYEMFRKICDSTIPMAVVISGLERETNRMEWWSRNEVAFTRASMKFNDHACIAGVRGVYSDAYDASAKEVKAIIKRAYLCKPRNQNRQQWISMVLGNMRTLIPGSSLETVDEKQLHQKLKKLGVAKNDREDIVQAFKAS